MILKSKASRLRDVLYRRFFQRFVIFFKRCCGFKIFHYVHVGKTAGTAIKKSLKEANRDHGSGCYFVVSHDHSFSLDDVKKGDFYFFSVRDPLSRFYSGFYSRKRKGQPKYWYPWRSSEEIAFKKFGEANDLAEALSSNDCEERAAAIFAMMAIEHVNSSYWDWFPCIDRLFYYDPPSYVLRQEFLAEDFNCMVASLGLPDNIKLPTSDVDSHKNDYSKSMALSDKAKENLRSWYKREYAFLDALEIRGLYFSKVS